MEDLIFSVLGQSSNFMSDSIKLKSDVKELQERLIDRTATFLGREVKYLRQIHYLNAEIKRLNLEIESLHNSYS